LYATVEGVVEVKLSGNLAVSRAHDKREAFSRCSLPRQLELEGAIGRVQVYIEEAITQLNPLGNTQYTTWFGCWEPLRGTVVHAYLELMRDRFQPSTFTYDCRACKRYDILARVCMYIFQS
jgi:hypothetical protein